MYQKACGATVGTCTEAEHDRGDAIIVKEAKEVNLVDIDCSGFDIVKAVQYGAIDRVKELIDNGYDVNLPDNDTVTLLHWAAINNRVEIIKFLLDSKAIVDYQGGDLNSTPLHWATRQGHLASVVLLTNAGADPQIKDAEGCSCIHLAAQFGHTACVAYFIARDVSPDISDTGGMTALMWASWKILSLDPVRLLLTLGADPNLQDLTHGNTALHWAILARNPRAIWSLIIRGKANLDIKNHRGDTALQLLQQHIGSRWIHVEVADRIKDVTQQRSKTTLLMKIMMSERIKFWTLVLIPFFFLFTIGLILATNLFFILKLLLIGIFGTIVSFVKRIMLNEDLQAQLPLYFYWASKAFFYVSWIFFIGSVVSTFTTIVFIFLNLLLWICFMRLWKGDCGVIKLSHNQRLQSIIELSDQTLETGKNGFDPSTFCSACLVRKPKRSKHCSVCDRCVGKFDHHCPWIGNDVGIGNHRIFMIFLIVVLCVMSTVFYGGIVFYKDHCNFVLSDGIWNAILILTECSPWVGWMLINSWFHVFWVTILTSIQTYQIVFMGMTTNERINKGRYKHFMELGGKSPFSLGPLGNIAEFLQCNCFGLLKHKKKNWMVYTTKETEDLIITTDEVHYV